MSDQTAPSDPLQRIATAERDHTRQLVAAHLKVCQAPRTEPGALEGSCPECKSLAIHLDRCERQVQLLGTEAETESLW